MDDRSSLAVNFIVTEVRRQASHALELRGDIAAWPEAYDYGESAPGISDLGASQLFLKIQDRLAAVGILSQLLWPGNLHGAVEYRDWAKEARSRFGLPDNQDDSILGDRALRDHYIHLPERIHGWALQTETQQPWDLNIGAGMGIGLEDFNPNPSGGSQVVVKGLPKEAAFRALGGADLIFWDARLDLNELYKSLEALL